VRLLLDTHAFLWWIGDDRRLSDRARQAISADDNELLLSLASVWELAIKTAIGRFGTDDLGLFVADGLKAIRATLMRIELDHVLRVAKLPLHHRDPFDRLLIAQAQIEQLPILSADPWMARCDVKIVW
jgi:PIN domain nuclease of toxin-antitoxin system